VLAREDVVRQAAVHVGVDEECVQPEVELFAALPPQPRVQADVVQPVVDFVNQFRMDEKM
jgi:hypothetical protein